MGEGRAKTVDLTAKRLSLGDRRNGCRLVVTHKD
jgi:hypothetical protein